MDNQLTYIISIISFIHFNIAKLVVTPEAEIRPVHWKHLPDSSLTTVYAYRKVFWGSQCLDGPSVHHFGLSYNISTTT